MIRIGIIGLGKMGSGHAQYLCNGEVPGAVLTAVCDTNEQRLDEAHEQYGGSLKLFRDPHRLITSSSVDAVIVATPHYDHPVISAQALEHGLHVMCEKPAGVYTQQVRPMNEAAIRSGKVFAIMYSMRLHAAYAKLKDLISSGEMGDIKRINWITTNWYRPQSYYNSSNWRATWAGEGGGVLLNQVPHQLDLLQWICGMPQRVRAFAGFGKYHDIEVEDDVTAYMEYQDGATCVVVASTGDAPGTDRLEVSATHGKAVIEDDKLTFWRLRENERKFNREFTGYMGSPECWKVDIPLGSINTDHVGLTRNWIEAIRTGAPLLAPGEEGINSLEISNAMHLSAWTDAWVNLPIDEQLFYEHLQGKINNASNTGRTVRV